MRTVYLCAGLYAEGPSDYYFLCSLLNRLLDALAAPLFAGSYEVADTIGIDAPRVKDPRAARIARAIADHASICELFVIHADGAGDPERARRESVEPGISEARNAVQDREVVAIGCVPVREIEAWLLADSTPFQRVCGDSFAPDLPPEPEKELDPKATLRALLDQGRFRPGSERVYALFGENVKLDALRSLPAFARFEADLVEAMKKVAHAQGYRG